MRVERYPENPLVVPEDVTPSVEGWEVMCSFNAGMIEYGDEILMLLRVAERPVCDDEDRVLVPVMDCTSGSPRIEILEFSRHDDDVSLDDPRVVRVRDEIFLTSISHLRLARSRDGRRFTIEETPSLQADQPYEAYGLEDPRITKIGDIYYVVYKGVASTGITQCLASTRDFVNWEKHGIIFCPENMDAMIFPEKVRGKYVALHRPQPKYIGSPNIWVAYSDDLVHWGDHKFLLGCSEGTWEGGRIGGGAVPFMTDDGWLEIYHAATCEDRYCLGAALLDKEHPEKLLAKSPEPILVPEAEYEVHGLKDNVVFTCGAVVRGDTVSIYYGAGDRVMAGADLSLREILGSLEAV